MANIQSGFEFENLDAWLRRTDAKRLMGKPLRRALSRSAEHAAGKTREGTPVDTGRLRNSFNTNMDRRDIPLWAEIGTNVKYARQMELGTRPAGELPRVFPDWRELQPWARRHGIGNAYLVARAIWRRGLRPRLMLTRGIESSEQFFRKQMGIAAREIEKNWERIR